VKIALKIQFANIHQVYACILQKQSKQKIRSDSTITFSYTQL